MKSELPRVKCIAFVGDDNGIRSAYNINTMNKATFGLLILEIEHLLKKLKEQYYKDDATFTENV